MKRIDLDGRWTIENREILSPSLFVTKKIYDEYFPSLSAEKSMSVYVTEKDSFTLQKEFSVTKEDLLEENLVLHFDRLDTLCNVFVNERKVGFFKNCHRSYDVDIKNCVFEETNILKIEFLSLTEYIDNKEKLISLPFNSMGIPHHAHIRKPASHFGWDFTAPLCAQGIGGHSEIRIYSHPVIENLDVREKKTAEGWTISASVKTDKSCSVIFSLTHPDGRTEKIHADENMSAVFEISDPKIWFCNTMGAQPLYTVSASVISDDGISIGKKEKKIGLRTLYLDRKKDEFGNSFRFFINGEPIFAKGANLVPFHMLYTNVTRDDIYDRLKKCKDANMNMIRVWGGGFYESDDFYDICDELGLLVWQDCAFACCAYPLMDEDFLFEVKEEIAENVSRIRHHASLCLWCGNNEIESISTAWLNRRSFINSTGEFFYKTLPALIERYDGETPYHQCSPGSGVYMKEPSGDASGDSHIWNTWHGFRLKDYYRKRFSRFCSETGIQSYPCFPVTVNQYCDLGEERLDFYLSKHFTLGRNEDERRYLTQVLQLEYMKEAAEHFRRNPNRCYGLLFWQLNDCWQSASWASLDVKGNKKAVMFEAKKFYENLHISAVEEKNSVEVFVTNENRTAFDGKVSVFFESTDGKKGSETEEKIFVRAFSSSGVTKIGFDPAERESKILIARLVDNDGNVLGENRLILCENKDLKLFDPNLKIETSVRAGKVYLTVTAEKYARYVELSCEKETSDFSENFFDLSAGESKTVEIFNPCAGLSEMLSVRSLFDVMKNSDKKKNRKRQFEVLRKPMVIVNIIGRIVGD
ncbi:MAG: hypothetical protein Q4D20_04565 [Clostridia bacterium]|nr:hypothetical protein [Clostridia bacterium]